ncbi:MAG: hypothetical protein LBU60_01640 [Clostridiales bacterium]|jgi:hypothetical protein|nr:hypothetical protein [Clostridiales bacterium]
MAIINELALVIVVFIRISMASTMKDILAFLKPLLDQYTGGKTLPKFAIDMAKKHTVKQITKWTPNLSKTVLYAKSNRGDLGSAFLSY